MLPHRPAGVRCAARVGPNRVIDVETTAALLPKPRYAACGLIGAPAPHTETTEPARIGHRRDQCRRACAAHRCLQDGPLEVQSLGQGVNRPHTGILPVLRQPSNTAQTARAATPRPCVTKEAASLASLPSVRIPEWYQPSLF